MQTFSAYFSGQDAYGDYIIVANTESEALGLALEAQPTSNACNWSLELIDQTKPSVTLINITPRD